jgi:transposase, IS5 family
VPLPPAKGRSIGSDSRRLTSRGMPREVSCHDKTGENSLPTNGENSTPAHKGVWADRACRSVQIEAGLKAKGLQSRIHRRAARNRPLSERQKSANTTRSRVRARVEHVFGHQQNSMGGKIVRTIGIARARFKIGMMNLGYNIRRLVQLERLAAVPA